MKQIERPTVHRRHSSRGSAVSALIAVLLVFALTALSGCGMLSADNSDSGGANAPSEASEPGSAPAGSESPDSASGESASGKCDNPYYPVDTGKIRKYKLDSKLPDGDREFTLKQKMVDEETFAEIRSYSSGLTLSVNWVCTDEGLRMTQYLSEAQMAAAQFQMETVESAGLTIPQQWETGKEWTSTYEVEAKLDAGPVKQTADGTVTIEHKLASESEKVTVAGGDFDAAKIDNVIKLNLKVGGRAIPTREVRSSIWVSPEVGIVKQRVYSDFGEATVEFTGFE